MKREKLHPPYLWRYLVQQAFQRQHPEAPVIGRRSDATSLRRKDVRTSDPEVYATFVSRLQHEIVSERADGGGTMDRGVIYIATGPVHVAEALVSAASVKRHMPDLPITLFSDVETADPNIDQIARIESDRSRPNSAAKHTHITASPYHQTLYLDTDTFVCGNLDDLFALLEVFDLAAAHSPTRAMHEVDGVPDSFPELNAGVILFRRCAAVEALFSKWADAFARNLDRLQRGEIRWLRPAHQRFHLLGDQGAFREALYRSTVRIATLPPEYNCRFSTPGFVDGPVRILHGRGVDLSRITARINAASTWRGYEERAGALRLRHYPAPTRNPYSLSNIRYTLRRRGLHWTVHAGLRRLVHVARRSEL